MPESRAVRGLGLLHHAQPLEGVREAARIHRIGDPIGGVFGALLPVAHRDADAGHLDHGQIIVAVADRHRVGERHAHGGRSETQSLALAARHQVAERNAIPPRLLARGGIRVYSSSPLVAMTCWYQPKDFLRLRLYEPWPSSSPST